MAYHGKAYNSLINCAKWRTLRSFFLSQHPFCEQCLKENRHVPAQCVHHITPVEDGRSKSEMEQLAYSVSNLQALCIDCHVQIHKEAGQKTSKKLLERKEQRAKRAIDQLFTKKE